MAWFRSKKKDNKKLLSDSSPYVARKIPVSNGNLENMKKIVGASIVWNQLGFEVGKTETNQYVSMFKPASASFKVNLISGHKYLISFIQPSGCAVYRQDRTGLTVGYKGYASPTTNTKIMFVASCTETRPEEEIAGLISKSATTEEAYNLTDCMFTDLTAMFNTEIADYVYTLETAEAESGIAWLQSYGFFTEDYHAYKQNTLESGCVSAKKIYGENLYPESAISGESNGVTVTSNNGVYTLSGTSSDYAQFISDEVFTLEKGTYNLTQFNWVSNIYVQLRSTDGQIIYASTYSVSTQQFTLTSKTKLKVRIVVGSTDIVTDRNIQIEITYADKTPTVYSYYTENTYLIYPITIRGLLGLSNGKLTVNGDEYNADGSVTRKYAFKNTFSRNGTDSSGKLYLIGTRIDGGFPDNERNVIAISNLFPVVRLSICRENADNGIKSICQYNNQIFISGYIGSETELDNILPSLEFIYLLVTPTTEQTTPFNALQEIKDGGTEEFVDYQVSQGNRDVSIPVGTETDLYYIAL